MFNPLLRLRLGKIQPCSAILPRPAARVSESRPRIVRFAHRARRQTSVSAWRQMSVAKLSRLFWIGGSTALRLFATGGQVGQVGQKIGICTDLYGFVRICTDLYGFVRICTEGYNQIQSVFSPYPSVPICTNPYSTKKHRHQASEYDAEKPDPEKAANER